MIDSEHVIAAYKHHLFYNGCKPEPLDAPGIDDVPNTPADAFASDMNHVADKIAELRKKLTVALIRLETDVRVCGSDDELLLIDKTMEHRETIGTWLSTDGLRDAITTWRREP